MGGHLEIFSTASTAIYNITVPKLCHNGKMTCFSMFQVIGFILPSFTCLSFILLLQINETKVILVTWKNLSLWCCQDLTVNLVSNLICKFSHFPLHIEIKQGGAALGKFFFSSLHFLKFTESNYQGHYSSAGRSLLSSVAGCVTPPFSKAVQLNVQQCSR